MNAVRPKRHWCKALAAVAVSLALASVAVRWLLVKDPIAHSAMAHAEFQGVLPMVDAAALSLQVLSFALLFAATVGPGEKRFWLQWLTLGTCVLIERFALVPIFHA